MEDLTKEELLKEIQKRDTLIKIIEKDAEIKQTEMLKRIANKLKVEYLDFKSAKDIPMSIDLGENMREQIATIFKILNKSGIIIE